MRALYKSVLLLLLALSLLSACASKDKSFSHMREVFTTEIDNFGSKRFTYLLISRTKGLNTLGLVSSKDKSSNKQNRQGRTFERVGANKDELKEDFVERLAQFLLENQYCRSGYMELDFTAVITEIQLVGECNESATPQDIEKWQVTRAD